MKRFILYTLLLMITCTSHSTPPPAKNVFQLSAEKIDPNTFQLQWNIKPGFFLYRDRIHLLELPDDNFHLGDIRFPKALIKIDQQQNPIKIYRQTLTLPVAVLGDQAGEGLLNVGFQGCSDDGFCYPPQTRQLKLAFNERHELIDAALEPEITQTSITQMMAGQGDSLNTLFASHNWLLIFLSFFGFGLLLAFTPCVLPMVPVLSGIIIGQGQRVSLHRAFFLSLSYVLSMAFTYALIGATVAQMGSNLQLVMQSPWALASFSLVFVLLALSMFGCYDLKLPNAWQHKLTKLSHHRASGGYVGAAIMGCLATLILSPCVTAPLIGALGYIASTGDMFRGSLALFFLGLGMGTPLLIIGLSAGRLLPRSGQWMNAVKAFFGILLIAVAINLLGRILPGPLIMGLWASLLIFSGIYAGALTRATSNHDKFLQSIGLVSLLYGLLILIGASQGHNDPLQPLALRDSPSTTNGQTTGTSTVVKTLAEVQQAMANAQGTPVILDFYADWCSSCQSIKNTTLNDPAVKNALTSIKLITVDVTENNDNSRELLSFFHVVAPPTFIFYNSRGQEDSKRRLYGEISATTLLKAINQHI